MNTLFAAVSGELVKIRSMFKYKLIFILSLAGMLVVSATGILGVTKLNLPYNSLNFALQFLAPISMFMLASDLLAGEVASGEIKVWFLRPISRGKLFFAKLIAICIYELCILACFFLISLTASIVSAGISTVSVGSVFSAYLVGIVPLITFGALAVMCGAVTKSGTTCFFFSIFIYLGLWAVSIVFPKISSVLFTSYLGISSMVIGSTIPYKSLVTGLLILIGYAVAFVSAGVLRFQSREI